MLKIFAFFRTTDNFIDKVSSSDFHSHSLMALLKESQLTLRLAFPLMIGQLSQMLLGVADTVMVGHLGVTELAALTLVNSLVFIPFVFGIGLLSGISVFSANAHGANDKAGARGSCRHGLYLAVALGLVLFGIGWVVSLGMNQLGQPQVVADRATNFFRIIMGSLIPALAAIALKNHADALQRPWPPFWIFLGGVLLNVGLNWVMIHGKLGCPSLGMEGAAWATLISRICILVVMFLWLVGVKELRDWLPYRWFSAPDFGDLRRLLSVGFPASLQMLCEVSAFSMAGLIMGQFGQISMAAHQIAITLASVAFMIPLGLSMALSVQLGSASGAGEKSRLRPIIISGWILAAGYSLVAAGIFLIFGEYITSLFISVPDVISLTNSLLVVVGLFQLVDSIQVTSSAMLRGLQDARVPAVMGFVAYWVVGLPVAVALALLFKMAALGVWCGLAIGLFVACITLAPRLWKRSSEP
jgi:multidrug resistance protein, MATE family